MSLPLAHPEMWMPRIALPAPTDFFSCRNASPHPATVLGRPASSATPLSLIAA
jgi:hypothetical protein